MSAKTKTGKSVWMSGNVPAVGVGKIVDMLVNMYESVINKGVDLTAVPAVMLWGPPGVGKSQGVKQIAARLEKSTGKKCNVTDVRLLLFNPIDLRGIPTANEDKTLAVWLRPQIFDMDPSDDVVNILFLDEISAAPQSVQAAAYQITLDRKVGEHKLPNNCIVIAAGNRVTDKSVASKMPKALANRMLHIETQVNAGAWHDWAIANGINEKVIGFIAFKPDYLMHFDASTDDLAFPTPRAWEMVSNLMNNLDAEIGEMMPLISGIVGTGAAIEFKTWTNVYNGLPDLEKIFDGTEKSVPKSPDVLYALLSAMAKYAYEHKTEMKRIANSIVYADKMPPDFSTVLMKDYMNIEPDYVKKLIGIPEFEKWLRTKGTLLNKIK